MPRISTEEALARIAEASPGVEVLGTYVNTETHLLARCRECEYEWMVRPDRLMEGRGCKRCNILHRAAQQRTPEAEALANIAYNCPDVELVSPYVAAEHPITARCRHCSREWETTPSRLANSRYGCKPCFLKRSGLARRRTLESIRSRAHPDVIVLGYCSDKGDKLHARCHVCQHEWHPLAGNLVKGSMCPRCVKQRSNERLCLPREEVIARLHKAHPQIELLDYRRVGLPMKVRCRECDISCQRFLDQLLEYGCPGCRTRGYSFHLGRPAIAYYLRLTAAAGGFIYKIGVTSRSVEERYAPERLPLIVLRTWSFERGADARAFEQEVLARHRAHRYQGPPLLSYTGIDELFTCDVLGLDRSALIGITS